MYYYSTTRLILIYRRVEGWVDLATAVSVQPVPKAAYLSDFCENTNFCPQRDSNLGPLAQQASVLPLDHRDLSLSLSEFVSDRDQLQVLSGCRYYKWCPRKTEHCDTHGNAAQSLLWKATMHAQEGQMAKSICLDGRLLSRSKILTGWQISYDFVKLQN